MSNPGGSGSETKELKACFAELVDWRLFLCFATFHPVNQFCNAGFFVEKNMLKEAILSLSQRPIAVYPAYIKLTGSLPAGMLLSQIMYWWSKMDRKFYKTDAEIIAETGLSEAELKTAKKKLKSLPFLTMTREGVPCKTYYAINAELVGRTLQSQFGEINQTGLADSAELVGRNQPNKIGEINQTRLAESAELIQKTTTETTTEITTNTSRARAREVPKQSLFDRFWDVYPKKVEKKKCAAIWKRRKLDDLGELIIADVTRRQIDDVQWQRGYIPNPQTYLNGDRWEDEIQTRQVAHSQGDKSQEAWNAAIAAAMNEPNIIDGEFTRD